MERCLALQKAQQHCRSPVLLPRLQKKKKKPLMEPKRREKLREGEQRERSVSSLVLSAGKRMHTESSKCKCQLLPEKENVFCTLKRQTMNLRETHHRTSPGQHMCHHRTAWGPFQTCSLLGESRTWLLMIECEIRLSVSMSTKWE